MMSSTAIQPATTKAEYRKLAGLAIKIEQELNFANGLAIKATEKYIEVGKYLLEARAIFPGDLEFGRWRATAVPNIKTNWAGRLMQVAGDQRLAALPEGTELPISVLSELASASDAVVERVVAESKDPEKPKPTVAAVREVKKEERKSTAPDQEIEGEVIPAPKTTKVQADNKPKPPSASLQDKAQRAIDRPFLDRLMVWNEHSQDAITVDPFIVFGMGSSFADTAPNLDDFVQLQDMYLSLYGDQMNEADKMKLAEAWDSVKQLGQDMRGEES